MCACLIRRDVIMLHTTHNPVHTHCSRTIERRPELYFQQTLLKFAPPVVLSVEKQVEKQLSSCWILDHLFHDNMSRCALTLVRSRMTHEAAGARDR